MSVRFVTGTVLLTTFFIRVDFSDAEWLPPAGVKGIVPLTDSGVKGTVPLTTLIGDSKI